MTRPSRSRSNGSRKPSATPRDIPNSLPIPRKVFDLRADLRHSQPLSESQIEELFAQRLTADEQKWVHHAFSKPFECEEASYQFDSAEIKRLSVKFAPSLKLNEDLFDAILKARNGAAFDFEPSLDEAETLTSAKELIFYMHWLKERGRPAQLVPPNLGFKKRQAYPESRPALEKYTHHKMWPEVMPRVDGAFAGEPVAELKDRVRELADVASYFDGTLSIHSGSGKQAEVLRSIGSATDGRLNYKISGELQLQLFDVLSESPEGSAERALYDRMVAACERFAAQGAFGEESALAAQYRASGHGAYLGNASAGRVDGNLFLVFWLGNMVGCKDEDGRFFKTHLDELPPIGDRRDAAAQQGIREMARLTVIRRIGLLACPRAEGAGGLSYLLALALLGGSAAYAQDTRTVTEPVIPPTCVTLTAHSQAPDDAHPDTARIQSALDHCTPGHAVELKPEGAAAAFLTGPIQLRAGVTLLIDANSTLYASRNPRDYDVTPGSCGIVNQAGHGCKPVISGGQRSPRRSHGRWRNRWTRRRETHRPKRFLVGPRAGSQGEKPESKLPAHPGPFSRRRFHPISHHAA